MHVVCVCVGVCLCVCVCVCVCAPTLFSLFSPTSSEAFMVCRQFSPPPGLRGVKLDPSTPCGEWQDTDTPLIHSTPFPILPWHFSLACLLDLSSIPPHTPTKPTPHTPSPPTSTSLLALTVASGKQSLDTVVKFIACGDLSGFDSDKVHPTSVSACDCHVTSTVRQYHFNSTTTLYQSLHYPCRLCGY